MCVCARQDENFAPDPWRVGARREGRRPWQAPGRHYTAYILRRAESRPRPPAATLNGPESHAHLLFLLSIEQIKSPDPFARAGRLATSPQSGAPSRLQVRGPARVGAAVWDVRANKLTGRKAAGGRRPAWRPLPGRRQCNLIEFQFPLRLSTDPVAFRGGANLLLGDFWPPGAIV